MSRLWLSVVIVLLPAAALAQGSNFLSRLARPVLFQQEKHRSNQQGGEAQALPNPRSQPPARRGLTLADVEAVALANSPTLARAGARIDAARGRWLQAGLYLNPKVGYAASEIGNEGDQGQQGIYIGYEFVTGHKLRLSQEVAFQEVRLAQERFAAWRFRLLNDVRIAFFNMLVSQRRVNIVNELVTIGERGVNTAEALLKAMEVSLADKLRALVELDTARIVLAKAEFEMLGNWRVLTAVMGTPRMPAGTVYGNLDDDFPQFTWDGALDRLLRQSPEMAMAVTRIDRARWALSRATAEPIPNISVQATIQQDTSTDDTVVGIQATIPIPVFNWNQGAIQASRSELVAAERDVDRVALALQRRLAIVFARYEGSKRAAEKYKRDILPNSQRTLKLVVAGYEQGEFKYTDLLSVQRTFFQASLTYLDAVREMRGAIVRIEGLLLTGSLEN